MANNEETHSTETSSQIVEQSQIEEQPQIAEQSHTAEQSQTAEQSESGNNGRGNSGRGTGGKGVTVLLLSDVIVGRTGEVFVPDNEEMAKIKKTNGRFKNSINFISEMSARDVKKTLLDEFDILKSHR